MKIAYVFPGQASQYAGMGKEFYQEYPEAAAIYQKADEALGFSLSRLCFEGPQEELNLTANTQPAVLTTSAACLAVLSNIGGLVPGAVAGHSLGEYTALVAAGSLVFEDAVRLVRKRGQYMQEAVPVGAGGMAAILGLSTELVAEACLQASAAGVVEAVNLNCPGQVVIAGDTAGLEAAGPLLKAAGARRVAPLPVSAPFHSSLMIPAGKRLAADLEQVTVADPQIPVVANVSADLVCTGQEVKDSLIKQVYSPVRWEECVLKMISLGVDTFIEVGPGKVLSGLIKKISRDVTILNVEDRASLEKILALTREVS
ncbi:MAG: ACP S-malonyltransferase [Desulfotomaculaceae bacterium]|nr:ACP S-malonyltransferase [Desulfotomaculaceae bacterium]MDD4767260.1 ACP S-malonyltransferase [Desulfotomaculaceae bacterium]